MRAHKRGGLALRPVTPLDIALIAVLIAAGVLMLLLPPLLSKGDGALIARITCGGAVYEEIDLSAVTDPYELELPTDPQTTVSVSPGSIRFSRAECPDQLCVNTGALTRPGDTAACLPAGVVITLYTRGQSADDIITY